MKGQPKKIQNRRHISMLMSEEMYSDLTQLANTWDISVSTLIRMVLAQYLNAKLGKEYGPNPRED